MKDDKTTIDDIKKVIVKFINERDWDQYHTPKNLSMAIATEAAELMEHFRWVQNAGSWDLIRAAETRDQIVEEVADVLAFLLSFANAAQIDLSAALHAKLVKNASKYPAEKYRGRY